MAAPPRKERILVVDDSATTLEVLERSLTAEGYQVFTSEDACRAIGFLKATAVDLVITDLKMPTLSGLDLVRHVTENLRNTEVMMVTGYASIPGAVEAVRMGAHEYLPKPFTNEELVTAVRGALERLRSRRTPDDAVLETPGGSAGIVAESEAMRAALRAARKAAGTNATVLITGESGAGKELIARAVHYQSPRASASFVPVNCGGIPEGLLESELFGHVKGAFTGAFESRAGFFQSADGGSIFLAEVAEMSLSMQVKLLRALQDRVICMVGSDRPLHADVRILAATNKDLQALIRRGTFREDLFYRLNVLPINVPPLRERGDDIMPLIRHFAEKASRESGRPPLGFSHGVLRILRGYSWPGNVRELENLVQRLEVMSEDRTVGVPDLPPFMRFAATDGARLDRPLADVEAEHIRNVLRSVGGNKTRAAEILGINRKTLRDKIGQHGIGTD